MQPVSSLRDRLIVALPLAILLLAGGFCVGAFGLAAGVMGGDSCTADNPPDWVSLWLTVVWPLSVLVSALLPPLLIALGRSYKLAALGFAGAASVAFIIWLVWFPILGRYC